MTKLEKALRMRELKKGKEKPIGTRTKGGYIKTSKGWRKVSAVNRKKADDAARLNTPRRQKLIDDNGNVTKDSTADAYSRTAAVTSIKSMLRSFSSKPAVKVDDNIITVSYRKNLSSGATVRGGVIDQMNAAVAESVRADYQQLIPFINNKYPNSIEDAGIDSDGYSFYIILK